MHDPNFHQHVTEKLINHVRTIDSSGIPSVTVDRALDLIVDHVGVSLYGATFDWCRIVRETVEADGNGRESTIYGGGLASARNAALANGVAGHAIEFDDTHDESLSHPGCVIIPAALAIAEAINASGPSLLAAIVAGYEAQCRIGAAMSRFLVSKGLHPTAQIGVFGATAAAGCLLRLSDRQFHRAFGLAASMASGIMKFTEDPEGTMVKRLHAGLPAERGILAARLAAAGFTGPRNAIEGGFGYAKALGGLDDVSRATRNLGEVYEVENCSIKLYPCCRMFHALIEAIAACTSKPSFNIAEIDSIVAYGPSNMVKGHMEYRPDSVMAAQYSLPYVVAVATIADPCQPDLFSIESMRRPDLLAVSDKVTGQIDTELEALYPVKAPARVEFRLKDGSVLVNQVLDSLSTPARPIGSAEVDAKFRTVTATVLEQGRRNELLDTIRSLKRLDSVRLLAEQLRAPTAD